ncbi:MAG: ABC transporter ATP-binding protein [Oscillospiraceae bacterium]|nr:ABC transporter ATP-binding protein [Oscillospiraceae bacterium]
MKEILAVNNLCKEYKMGEVIVPVLRNLSFSIYEGEFVVILGQSGSGKTTLMNMIGGVDRPTEGEIIYRNRNIASVSERELTVYRRDAIGFVFQFYNLIQNLTVKENIEVASKLSKNPIDLGILLERTGMSTHESYFPSQLSGGQQQRVAIARAIVKNPSLLLCDEPTGALDSYNGIQVFSLLKDFNRTFEKTIVIITHNTAIAEIADRIFYLRDGMFEKIENNNNPMQPEDVVW